MSDDKNDLNPMEMLLHEVRQNGRRIEKVDDKVNNIYSKAGLLGALLGAIAGYLGKFFH